MNTKLMVFSLLMSLFSGPVWAADTPWIFTSTIPAKNEMVSIDRKETCHPLDTQLMSPKCTRYRQGFVCQQQGDGRFIITTYDSKNECDKALKKARRLFAQK